MKATKFGRLRSLVKSTGPETEVSVRDILTFPGASLAMVAAMLAAFFA